MPDDNVIIAALLLDEELSFPIIIEGELDGSEETKRQS